jgi:predicted transcriptional regulator
MAARTTSIRLHEETLGRLDRLAQALDRSRSWVIDDAINRYIDHEEWFLEAVDQGIAAADRGEVIPHEKLVEKWEIKRGDRLDTARRK